MRNKCYICKKYYKKDEGIYEGIVSFLCINCLKERLKKSPIGKKLFSFFIFLFLFSPVVFSNNISLDKLVLYSPSYYTINETININNESFFVNKSIECLENITETSVCDITKTLGSGEQYINNENSCKVDFKCEETNFGDIENISYNIGWKVYNEDGKIYITYINENETRDYPSGEKFSFEDEFEILCPSIEKCNVEDSTSDYLRLFNLTDDEWYDYYLGQFGIYGKTLEEVTSSLADANQKIQDSCIDTQATNIALSKENGELKVMKENYEKIQEDFKSEEKTRIIYQEKSIECEKELEILKSKGSYFNIFVLIVFIFECIIGFILLMKKLFFRIAGVDLK